MHLAWNMKWEVEYMMSYTELWKGSKLHAYLKIKESLTWCLMCFPKTAITYFNPEVYKVYALHVSVLYTLFCFSLDLTNYTWFGPKPNNMSQFHALWVTEENVWYLKLQFAGSPPISLNPFGNLGYNSLSEAQQFVKAGLLYQWNGRNFKYDLPFPWHLSLSDLQSPFLLILETNYVRLQNMLWS